MWDENPLYLIDESLSGIFYKMYTYQPNGRGRVKCSSSGSANVSSFVWTTLIAPDDAVSKYYLLTNRCFFAVCIL